MDILNIYEKCLNDLNNLSKDNNFLDISDVLYDFFASKDFIIDNYPMVIKDNKKIAEIEVFYDKGNGLLKKEYFNYELKYIKVFQKIWCYNELFIDIDNESLNPNTHIGIKRALSKGEFNSYLKFFNNYEDFRIGKYFVISKMEYLTVILKLCLREKMSATFLFKDFELILLSNGLSFVGFLNNLDNKNILDKICTCEGLYIR